jgi:hypothetical protein
VITIEKATPEHVRQIVPKITDSRLCAVWRTMGRTPEQAALYSVERSTFAWAGFADGEIGALFGVGAVSLLSDMAMPWLIPTDLVKANSIGFLRRSRPFIREVLDLYPHLYGYVEEGNDLSATWLKWLGFKVDDPQFIQPLGASFRRFEMVTHG